MANIDSLAQFVDDAARNATEIPQLSDPITLEDAYAIQKKSLARRYARGERQGRHQDGFHEPREDGPDGRPRHDLGSAHRRG